MGIFNRKKEVQTVEQRDIAGVTAAYTPLYKMDDSAMTLSAVYAAIQLISDSVASIPIEMHDADGNVDRTFVESLLRMSDMTKFMMVKCVMRDVLLKGKGYVYIQRDTNGKPFRLYYIPHGYVVENYNNPGGKVYYTVTGFTLPNNVQRIDPKDMLCIYKDSSDGIRGLTPIVFAGRSFDTGKYADKAANDYFASGMDLLGILTVQGNPSKEAVEEIRAGWGQVRSGEKNNRTAILRGNMKYESIGAKASDSQLLETREFTVKEVARFFNISPLLLGDLTHSQYNSIEQAMLQFVMFTLMPYISSWESEMTKKLCAEDEWVDFDENSLLRTDKSSLSVFVTSLVRNGVMSINEARLEVGLNAVEGGDKLIIPFSNAEASTIADNIE